MAEKRVRDLEARVAILEAQKDALWEKLIEDKNKRMKKFSDA